MAHFAEIDDNNIVLRVVVIHNNELLDENGNESEERGVAFCKSIFSDNVNTRWIQTSFNSNFRKNFASSGSTYDPVRDAFIPVKPFPSWILDESTCKWKPPIDYPSDGLGYFWDERNVTWVRGMY